MTPEKFFDYLEGKLPPAERERLERALIADPELQQQFVTARQIHRTLQRPVGESSATTRAGSRGRQLAAAFGVLVAMNVALGLFYIFRTGGPPKEMQQQRDAAIRQRLQGSLEKSAAAAFTPPTLGIQPVELSVARDQQDVVAQKVIAAATEAGGSGAKGLPDENGTKVLVLIPAPAEARFRETLHALGGPVPNASPSANPATPNDTVHLEIVLTPPR
jgi:hypothetical protein